MTAHDKILTEILTRLQAADPARHWFIDRADTDPLTEAELPGIAIRLLNDDFGPSEEHGQDRHRATIQFDCQSGLDTGLTIDAVNRESIAIIVETLWDDGNPTLGGRLESIEPDYADASEQSVPDVGWAVLQCTATFYTPRGDWRTIVSAAGVTF